MIRRTDTAICYKKMFDKITQKFSEQHMPLQSELSYPEST
jgi:hypothetical protein